MPQHGVWPSGSGAIVFAIVFVLLIPVSRVLTNRIVSQAKGSKSIATRTRCVGMVLCLTGITFIISLFLGDFVLGIVGIQTGNGIGLMSPILLLFSGLVGGWPNMFGSQD